jgi:hypothetical protein
MALSSAGCRHCVRDVCGCQAVVGYILILSAHDVQCGAVWSHLQVLREAEVSTRMNHPNVVATVSGVC